MMKTPRTKSTARIGSPPAAPAEELTPKAAQVVADQEWEDEGGSIKPAKKPDLQPKPKLPL
jgi:hypothetical protein